MLQRSSRHITLNTPARRLKVIGHVVVLEVARLQMQWNMLLEEVLVASVVLCFAGALRPRLALARFETFISHGGVRHRIKRANVGGCTLRGQNDIVIQLVSILLVGFSLAQEFSRLIRQLFSFFQIVTSLSCDGFPREMVARLMLQLRTGHGCRRLSDCSVVIAVARGIFQRFVIEWRCF